MPHISIEASPALVGAVDWPTTLQGLHAELAHEGWAALADLKSRVHPIAAELCGADPGALQLVATLTLTRPRPPHICERMADTVSRHLSSAVNALQPRPWIQCCVFLRLHPLDHYRKRQWNAPGGA